MSRNTSIDMTSGPILVPLIKYTLPIILTSNLQLLFNAADIATVGQFSDSLAVASVSACSALIQLMVNLFLGISLGCTVVLASAIGARNTELYEKITHTSIALGIIGGLITSTVGVIFAKQFLTMLGTPENILSGATTYLRIYMSGNIAFMIFTFARAVLVATGDTKRPMIYLTLSGVINVILNIVLVAGFNLGVVGVACATVTSQVVSAVLMIRALITSEGPCRLTLSKIRINGTQCLRILKLGLPAGFQSIMFSITNVMNQSSINRLGTEFVAGNGAGAAIDGFIYVTNNSFSQGCLAFAGQNMGANKIDRLNRIYLSAITGVCTIGVLVSTVVYFNGEFLLGLFIPDSPLGIKYGMYRLLLIALPDFLCGLMDCTSNMLRGLKRSIFPMIACVLGTCVTRLGWIVFVFNRAFPYRSNPYCYKLLMVSYPMSWLLTFLALLIYYIVIKRKLNKTYYASSRDAN